MESGQKQDKAVKKEAAEEDKCRCEEVSRKTPMELLRLMLRDLAFWKKKKPN